MARKISQAEKMTMKTMKEKGSSQREIARLLETRTKKGTRTRAEKGTTWVAEKWGMGAPVQAA